MFEVNLFTPAQFGAFIPWLVINRGPLSALIHPNSVNPETGEHDEAERDHTQRATWMGERLPLNVGLFKDAELIKAIRESKLKQKDGA
jgi:aromatic ring-cleaving dioxygenase